MAKIILHNVLTEATNGAGNLGKPLKLQSTTPEYTGLDAVTWKGTLADATTPKEEFAGLIAPDTGIFENGALRKFTGGENMFGEPNTVARVIENALILTETPHPVGTKVTLGADGILEDAGTGLVVGIYMNHTTTKNLAQSYHIMFDTKLG
jgi:hypothetical protein